MYYYYFIIIYFFYYIKNVIKKCVFGRFCLVVCLFIIINKMFSFCVVRFFCALAFAYASNREEEDSLRRERECVSVSVVVARVHR